jgi:hypothetical protein
MYKGKSYSNHQETLGRIRETIIMAAGNPYRGQQGNLTEDTGKPYSRT